MKEMMILRTTLNISEEILKETETLYNTKNRSKAVENALKDAIRLKKLQLLMDLKGKLNFDEEEIEKMRSAETDESDESKDNC